MSCVTKQEQSIARLKFANVLTDKLEVKDLNALLEEQKNLRDYFITMLDKDFENALGVVGKDGELVINNRPAAYERKLKKQAFELYKETTESAIPISMDFEVLLTPQIIADAYTNGVKNLEILVRRTSRTISEPWTLMPLQLAMGLSNIKGPFALLNDVAKKDNLAIITAAFPNLAGPIKEGINVAKGIEMEFMAKAEATSAKEVFEDLIETTATEDLVLVNALLNNVLEITNTPYTVGIGRETKAKATGSASPTFINMGILNSAITHIDMGTMIHNINRTYIHEKMHIASFGFFQDLEYRAKMEELYGIAKKTYMSASSYKEGDKLPYGLEDVFEFVSEGFSNPKFQKFLSSIPYKKEKSIFERLIEAFSEQMEKLLGVKVDGTILGELFDMTNITAHKFATNKIRLNNIDTEQLSILKDINSNGIYQGELLENDLNKWANFNGMFFKDNRFYSLEKGIALDRHAIGDVINFDKTNYYYSTIKNVGRSFEETLVNNEIVNAVDSGFIKYSKDIDIHAVNGDIDMLHVINDSVVTTPNKSINGYYEILGTEYFRATGFLGFSANAADPLVKNATKIGNIADELAKRIFRGDSYDEYTYEKVSNFVKQERFEYENKISAVDAKQWETNYKNPVSQEGFEDLQGALEKMRDKLILEHNVTQFHTDIVVWDKDRFVAGEIDILAEHRDGSFTVIDMKTRREGVNNYDLEHKEDVSTKTKHTKQTSLYSEMLGKLGFKVNPPMIIMAQPIYDTSEADNQSFTEIIPGEIATLIPLEYNTNYFSFSPSQDVIASKNRNVRLRYFEFERGTRLLQDQIRLTGDIASRDEQTAMLREKLLNLKNKLIEYTNITKRSVHGDAISGELSDLVTRLEMELLKDITKTSHEEQLAIMSDFFHFGGEQLRLLASELDNASLDTDEQIDAYFKISNYKGVFGIAQELFITLEELRDNIEVDKEEYLRVETEYMNFQGLNAKLNTRLQIKVKELAESILTQSYYGSKFEIKYLNTFRKEAEELYGKDEEKIKEFINKKRRDPKIVEEIREEYGKEIKTLLNSVNYDLSKAAFMVNSDVHTNNTYVQLMHNMLLQAEQRFSSITNSEIIALAQLEKKLGLSRKEVEALIVVDAQGDSFLQSKYSIEFYNEMQKHKQAIREAELVEPKTPNEREVAITAIKKAKDSYNLWKANNTKRTADGFSSVPIDKWLNDMSKFSDRQKEALNAFKEILVKNEKRIGRRSLIEKISFTNNTMFFRLPGVKQTIFGGVVRGDLQKAVKKQYDELTKREIDDLDEGGETDEKGANIRLAYTGLDGKPIYTVPIHFRGFPKEEQNKDLFTVFAMELQNGIRYEVDKRTAMNGLLLVDSVNNSKFFKTEGMDKKLVASKFRGKDSKVVDTIEGDASVTSQMLMKMLKNRMYSLTQEYAGNLPGGIDVNRATQIVLTYTAFSAMSFKVLSAGNNFVTGNISLAVEAAGGEFISARSLRDAKGVYYKNIMGILNDIGSPIKTNFVNQLMARFDVQSERNLLNNQFEKTNKVTQLLDPGISLFGYSMGEHEIHATLMLAILGNTRVLNKNGEYLDKEGKVTKDRKGAASLLDSYYLNDKGVLSQKEWAEYSEFETITTMAESGEAMIRGLIKDRVDRTQGAFGKDVQSEIDRKWWGKLFKQFKKHIAPQSLNRFRGILHIGKKTSELEEKDMYFNYNAKTEEYGYYTTFLRMLIRTARQERFNILAWKKATSDQWKEMTQHERANVIKTTTELSYIAFMMILASMAVTAAMDDDDDETMWALAYMLRRQVGDAGSQYFMPKETWRIMDSPMAAFRHLKNSTDTISQLFNPYEEYISGVHAKENKLTVKVSRLFLLDRLDQFEEGYNKRLFHGIDRD